MTTSPTLDPISGRTGDDQRTFKDDQGRLWIVYERTSWTLANPARRFLIFEAMHAMRRVSIFPGGWRALDALALERLSWAQ